MAIVVLLHKNLLPNHNLYHQNDTQINQEKKWIEAAKENPERFAPLYDKYYLQIFRFHLKRCADENLAAELTSNTFVKALNKIHAYEFRGIPLGAWLYQIARNEFNLSIRNKKYDRVVSVETHQLQEIIQEAEDTEQSEANLEKLVATLRNLNLEDLEFVEMRFFEKRSYKEISEIMDVSIPNAKVKVHRIIKKLKKMMVL